MREFDSEWQATKGSFEFEVSEAHQVDLWVSCTKKVQVLGLPAEKGKAAVVLKSGEEFRFRAPLYGFRKVIVQGTGETPFGLRARHSPRQPDEVIDPEPAKVLSLPEPSNLVAKMRRLAAEHHRFNRMPVLEPEEGASFGRYEFDDEDEVLFEEEAFAKSQEEAKERRAKAEAAAKARKDAEAKADPKQGAAPPPEAAQEPPHDKEAPKSPPAQHAAE